MSFSRLKAAMQAGPPPVPPPSEKSELQLAFTHMRDLNQIELTENLEGWYETLQNQSGPEKLAEFCAQVNADLLSKGNTEGTGPPIFLINTGDRIHMASCLTVNPKSIISRGNSPFKSTKYFLLIGEKEDENDKHWIVPTDANTLFTTKKAKLAGYGTVVSSMEEAPDNADTDPIRPGRIAETVEFFPTLPILGKTLCQEIYNGIYPDDEDSVWSYKTLAYHLRNYVEAITNTDVQLQVQASLMGLVTTKGQSQAGTIQFRKSKAPKSVLDFMEPVIAGTLNPTPFSPPGSDSQGGRLGRPDSHSHGDQSLPGADRQEGIENSSPDADHQGGSSLLGSDRQEGSNTTDVIRAWTDPTQLPSPRKRVHFDDTSLYGQPPFKRQKAEELTGYNSLSETKRCAILSLARARNAQEVSEYLIQLQKQPKDTRYLWFKTNLLKQCQLLDVEAFSDFTYANQFIDFLAEVDLTAADDSETWWKGFVGNQLRRSKEDIRALNDLATARRSNSGVQIQITPGQISRLSSKAPIPIDKMMELLYFLRRLKTMASLTYPLLETSRVASLIYDKLTSSGAHHRLSTDSEWIRTKPGEIVHFLCTVERDENSHMLSKCDFLDPDTDPVFFTCSDATAMINQCVSPGRTFLDCLLPAELRPRRPTNPNFTAGPSSGDGNRNSGGRARNDSTASIRGGNGGGRGNPATHRNDRFPQQLQDFWASVPDSRRREPLNHWLTRAGSSTAACLQQLGLNPSNDCGFFHLKGSCSRPSCNRNHTPRDAQQQSVEAVSVLLRTGLERTA